MTTVMPLIQEGLVLVRRYAGGWRWTCDVHSCDAAVYERHGLAMFWVTAQFNADAHARKHHHGHLCHDRD